ncbi:MAG TPA: TolC family protein [Methylibium sp.]|nr:TolC family protein [Methylibium sp.]
MCRLPARRALPLALVAALLGACAARQEPPRPPDLAANPAAWAAQRSDDAALREALAAVGVDTRVWPLPAWDAEALTALALQRHPELAVARAELRAAEAAAAQARAHGGRGAEFGLEHHSEDGRSSAPWSLGVAVDALLGGAPRRAAQAEQADALARESLEQAALAVWSLRQRVHAAQRGLALAERRRAAAEALHATRAEQRTAQEARLAAGAADASEAAQARQLEAEAARDSAALAGAARAARARLAEAVGLPLATLQALPLALDAALADPPALAPLELQRAALLNRLDLRAALARHDAAEAALRVELARQWPEITLKPGVAWDQGDRVWSLGLGLVLPPGGRNRAAIDAALAQRAAQAHRVEALQREALGRLDSARAALGAAETQRAAAAALHDEAARLAARTERRYAAGDADRSERLAARAALQAVEQQRLEALAERAAAVGALEDALQQPLAGPRPDPRLGAAPGTDLP